MEEKTLLKIGSLLGICLVLVFVAGIVNKLIEAFNVGYDVGLISVVSFLLLALLFGRLRR